MVDPSNLEIILEGDDENDILKSHINGRNVNEEKKEAPRRKDSLDEEFVDLEEDYIRDHVKVHINKES